MHVQDSRSIRIAASALSYKLGVEKRNLKVSDTLCRHADPGSTW
jgi:hypothetical protein